VGEWLESVAAEALGERARKVAEIESTASVPPPSAAASSSPRWARVAALAGGTAIVLALGAFAATRLATRAPAPPPAASSVAPNAESASAADTEVAADPGAADTPTPSAPSAGPHPPGAPRRAGPRPRPAAQCKPPYTVDANGARHWKSGC
jgi:serine/threonine-protein kinase